MRVELGNPKPHDGIADPTTGARVYVPRDETVVTYITIPEGDGGYDFDPSLDVRDLALHLMSNPSGVTNFPGAEALLLIVAQQGLWKDHSADKPSWVWSDNPDLERLLGELYDCPRGRPDDLEDTHYTEAGPAGVHPPGETA